MFLICRCRNSKQSSPINAKLYTIYIYASICTPIVHQFVYFATKPHSSYLHFEDIHSLSQALYARSHFILIRNTAHLFRTQNRRTMCTFVTLFCNRFTDQQSHTFVFQWHIYKKNCNKKIFVIEPSNNRLPSFNHITCKKHRIEGQYMSHTFRTFFKMARNSIE